MESFEFGYRPQTTTIQALVALVASGALTLDQEVMELVNLRNKFKKHTLELIKEVEGVKDLSPEVKDELILIIKLVALADLTQEDITNALKNHTFIISEQEALRLITLAKKFKLQF
ncbi:hypothetical protein IT409_00965 [Candidatus Falkowbacteria bacterium]|nr:hypothetical protein [Candidatus Falkowbacteria bacterium]